MKLTVGWLSLALAIFLALIIQEFIPPVRFFHGARVFLVPMLFCYGALAMPFWAMLLLAIYTGFLTDLAYLNVPDGHVEIASDGLLWCLCFSGFLLTVFSPHSLADAGGCMSCSAPYAPAFFWLSSSS